MTYQCALNTKIGKVYLVASEKGLRGVFLDKQSVPMVKMPLSKDAIGKILSQAVDEMNEYFAGKRTKFNVPLDLQGTPFQVRVWKELLKIPFGKTCSYRDIAKKIKNPKAVRAVGGANGKNPVCIIVPCHRVIAADGSLGGYSGGLNVKRKLLALEQVSL